MVAVGTIAATLLVGCGSDDKTATAPSATSSSAEATLKVVSTSAPATAPAKSYSAPALLVADLAAGGLMCKNTKVVSTKPKEMISDCEVTLTSGTEISVTVMVYPNQTKGQEAFSTWQQMTAAGMETNDVVGGANWVVKCFAAPRNAVCTEVQKAIGGTLALKQ